MEVKTEIHESIIKYLIVDIAWFVKNNVWFVEAMTLTTGEN